MSELRDKVVELLPERTAHNGGIDTDYPDYETAGEIIALCMDEAVDLIPDGIDGGNYEEDDYAAGWNHALNEFEARISKLKERNE